MDHAVKKSSRGYNQGGITPDTGFRPGSGCLTLAKITAVVLVLIGLHLQAFAAAPDAPVYEVGGGEVRYVDFPVYFVSDESRSVDVTDIAAGAIPGEVIPSRYHIPEVIADRWFIFDIRNSSGEPVTRIIRLDEAIFEVAELYYQQDGNWVRLQGGLNIPLNERALKNRTPSFAVSLSPEETRRLYLKFYSGTFHLTLGARLESPEQAVLFEQKFLFVYMMFFGAVGALLAYNLFLLLSLRDMIYLYYVMHGVCFLVWTAFYNGFDFYFHDNLEINLGLMPVVPLIAAFQTMFMRRLLDTRLYLPLLDRFLAGIALYFFAISAGTFVNQGVYHYLALSVPALVIVLLGTGIYSVYRRLPMAPYYLAASSGNVIGSFFLAGVCIGAIEYSFPARHGILIGFTAEMIIFALALAYRVKRLENEKLHYQKEATRIEKSAREKLEVLVDRRTAELRKSNLELEKLSNTDGLTGLLNRRYFDERLRGEWHRLQRSNGVLSLVIGDIDYFKKYNDHYGHVEGDHCLQRVARTIMDSVGRKSDVPARYGGEEFVVLMPETGLDGAREVAERILNSLAEENIPHRQSSFGKVTMSLGVAEFFPSRGQEPDEAVKKADALLYQAKMQGRGQVVSGPDIS